MKKFILIFCLFLLSSCTQPAGNINQPAVNEINNNSSSQAVDPKAICEKSGGKWENPCETGECFKCDCNQYAKNASGNSEIIGNKLLVRYECVACTSDEQCGAKSCGMARNVCGEVIKWCDAGTCKNKKVTYGTPSEEKKYQCYNNACVLLSEINKDNIPADPQKDCLLAGGTWKYWHNGCGDDCYDKTQGTPMCTQAFTWKCDCGDIQCWDGKKCVAD